MNNNVYVQVKSVRVLRKLEYSSARVQGEKQKSMLDFSFVMSLYYNFSLCLLVCSSHRVKRLFSEITQVWSTVR